MAALPTNDDEDQADEDRGNEGQGEQDQANKDQADEHKANEGQGEQDQANKDQADEHKADEDRGEQDHAGLAARIKDRKLSLLGGAVAAVMGFLTMSVVGNATSFEARRLLDAVIPTVRYSASAYIAGGGTILALMLTMITFSISHDLSFRPGYYSRISDIATLATTVIVGSVIVLMFLAFPLGEAGVAHSWYLWVFYAVLLGSAITGGLMVSTVLLLFYAIRGLITIGQDPSESRLVDVEGAE